MFEQKDLEAGKHMVITRDKNVYIVANKYTPADEWCREENTLFLMGVDECCDLNSYKGFKLNGIPSLDIVKVYSITTESCGFNHPQWQTLVWQEDATSKVKQKIAQLEDDISNREYHNGVARDKIKDLENLL